MKPTRREFMILAGATALGCGAIAAKRDAKSKEEKLAIDGLQVGDEVMKVESDCKSCMTWGIPICSLGTVYRLSSVPSLVYVCFPGNRNKDTVCICQKSLVRILPGPLEVGDRVIYVASDLGPVWLGDCGSTVGQRGTIFGTVCKSVRFDDNHSGPVWLLPDLVKIQEFS